MIGEELFEKVLLKPPAEGADKLWVVSGFATPTMASTHLDQVGHRLGKRISVDLIVGMTPAGVRSRDHQGFVELAQGDELGPFSCSYVMRDKAPVHSKLYLWLRGNAPMLAFAGSANYTHGGFLSGQREVLTPCDEQLAKAYLENLDKDTVLCTHDEVDDYVIIQPPPADEKTEAGLEHVRLSLLDADGEMHTAGGLNWGQRDHRNRNEAYIPVPALVGRSGFFPDLRVHFTVLTDDRKALICTRAQTNGKAIETPTNNSLLGEYFRGRIGVASGAIVEKVDIQRYGRTDVDFYKIDDQTYYMDFSRPRK